LDNRLNSLTQIIRPDSRETDTIITVQLILGKSHTESESELGRNQIYKRRDYETVGEVRERNKFYKQIPDADYTFFPNFQTCIQEAKNQDLASRERNVEQIEHTYRSTHTRSISPSPFTSYHLDNLNAPKLPRMSNSMCNESLGGVYFIRLKSEGRPVGK
jgi:hypothetical protein